MRKEISLKLKKLLDAKCRTPSHFIKYWRDIIFLLIRKEISLKLKKLLDAKCWTLGYKTFACTTDTLPQQFLTLMSW